MTKEQAPKLRRGSPEVLASKALRLVENPDFKEVFNAVRETFISDIEMMQLDGSSEKERALLEIVRQLQALLSIKRELVTRVRRQAQAEKPAELTNKK